MALLFKTIFQVVVPMIGVLSDSKVQLREKGCACLSSWLEVVPLKFWFDDEAISETLGDAKKDRLNLPHF